MMVLKLQLSIIMALGGPRSTRDLIDTVQMITCHCERTKRSKDLQMIHVAMFQDPRGEGQVQGFLKKTENDR